MSDLAERYGTSSPTRRWVLVAVVGAFAVAALGWLLWVMLFHGRPLAQSELVAFDVQDEHSTIATVSVVRRSRDVEASCLLRAQAADHSIVGELSFTVDSASPKTATLTQTIRTEREASAVELVGCTAEGQNRPR